MTYKQFREYWFWTRRNAFVPITACCLDNNNDQGFNYRLGIKEEVKTWFYEMDDRYDFFEEIEWPDPWDEIAETD